MNTKKTTIEMMLSLKEVKLVLQAQMFKNKDASLMPGLNKTYQEVCSLIEVLEHKATEP